MTHDQKLCLACFHLTERYTDKVLLFFFCEDSGWLVFVFFIQRIFACVDLVMFPTLETANGLQCKI